VPTNEQIVIDKVLEEKKDETAPDLHPDAFLSVFGVEQVLKGHDLSYEEIEAGIVDGGGDGGIDAGYIFLNGQLVSEDFAVPKGLKKPSLDLEIFTTKNVTGFQEGPLQKLVASLTDLLDLSKTLSSLSSTYNERLLKIFGRFREIRLQLATQFPRVAIRIHYVSRGAEVHPNVVRQSENVEGVVKSAFPDADFVFEFIGAGALLELAQSAASTSLSLAIVDNISTANIGFVCLVRLRDFFEFITDEDGELMVAIFEANVRDYAGDVEVNAAIRETLEGNVEEDFWWLNNGVTITATEASLAGKTLTILMPQIVNGLQTSTEIANYLADTEPSEDERQLLVRVLVPSSDEALDRIIRATNSQTAISAASLRATDPLHRTIEDYLRGHGWYYERRKNFYKNQGKPKERIIPIPYLAQGVMALVLQEPDNARARPSSLLKRDEDYKRVFSKEYPIDVYLKVPVAMRRVEEFLAKQSLSTAERNNFRFYVGYWVAAELTGSVSPTPEAVSAIALDSISDELLQRALAGVRTVFGRLEAETGYEVDRVAKSSEAVTALREEVGKLL
jgi:hypothetical protein